MDQENLTSQDFHRRRYSVSGEGLDQAKQIELIVRVDGQTLVHMQAREPGMLAFVSRPDAQGFEIDIVERGAERYTDARDPASGKSTEAIAAWQLDALGL